jgi:hypothetical protein
MKRFENWPTLLDEFLAERKQTPFCYGKHDCCLFAADAVLRMTGVDMAKNFRGTYHDAFTARRELRKTTGSGSIGEVAGWLCELHKVREIPVPMAQRGDVVVLLQEGAQALAIVTLAGTEAIAPGEHGLVENPIFRCTRAWRI